MYDDIEIKWHDCGASLVLFLIPISGEEPEPLIYRVDRKREADIVAICKAGGGTITRDRFDDFVNC